MKIILSAFLPLAFAAGAFAQNNNFNEALEKMVASNPEIAILNISNQGRLADMAAENVLEGPELEISPKFGKNGNKKLEASINQSFDWPGLYKARKAEQASTGRALTLLEKSTIVDKTLEAKQLLIEIIASKRTIAILERIDSSLAVMSRKYADGFKRGEVSILDVNKVEIEHLRFGKSLIEERNNLTGLISSAESFAGGENMLPLLNRLSDYPVEQILSEADYEKYVSESDPMAAHYEAMAEAASKNGSVRKLSALPSFSLGYGFAREEGMNFHGFNFGMKFSTWNNSAAKSASRLSALENTRLAQAEKLRRISDVRRNLVEAQNLENQVKALDVILGRGNQTELLKKALDGGQINLLTYIQEINFFIDAQLEYEQLKKNFNLSAASLNRLNEFVK